MRKFTTRYPLVTLRLYGVNWEADAPPSSAELEIRYGKGVWPGLDQVSADRHGGTMNAAVTPHVTRTIKFYALIARSCKRLR